MQHGDNFRHAAGLGHDVGMERHGKTLLIALQLEWTLDLQTESGHETSLLQMRCFGVPNLNL